MLGGAKVNWKINSFSSTIILNLFSLYSDKIFENKVLTHKKEVQISSYKNSQGDVKYSVGNIVIFW